MATRPVRSRFYMSPRKIEAATLRISGLTYNQVAAAMGISQQSAASLIAPPSTVARQVRARRHCADCNILIPKLLADQGFGKIHGHIHHDRLTKTPEEYNHISNLVLLCGSCHPKRHARERRQSTAA
jgi:hypothetical protein